MVAAKLYVEGGGDAKALKIECREAFRRLLEKAGLAGRMPRIVACGGRPQTIDDFSSALAARRVEECSFLLVDSEGPVSIASPWGHLERQSGGAFARPPGAEDDHCHFMVQCMEAWLLADRPALVEFFSEGFRANRLPGNQNVEEVSKEDLFRSLAEATKDCERSYGKGDNSFKVLMQVDPAEIEKVGPWARRFFATLRRLLL